jgi:hypothetical protein
MLTQAEVREMRALTTRVQKGSASREDWANLAALALVFQGDATTTAIAAEGFATFVARAAPNYAAYGFQTDDFHRIYQRVCAAATRVIRDRVH